MGVHECVCVQIRVCMHVYVMCVHADMDVHASGCVWVCVFLCLTFSDCNIFVVLIFCRSFPRLHQCDEREVKTEVRCFDFH